MNEKGLKIVFLDYQIAVWQHIWQTPDHIVQTLDAWKAVQREIKPKTVCRTSIINFLNRMATEGLLVRDDIMYNGIGGIKYYPVAGISDSEAALKCMLRKQLMKGLEELGE